MRHAPLTLTAVVVALVATLGGCGGSTTSVDDLPADAVFLSAVDRSTDVSTVRVRYESTARRDGEVFHSGSGEATFAPGAVSFTFTMGGEWAGRTGSDEDGGSPELSYELRFVDGMMYMRVPDAQPGLAEEDLPEAEWIVYDDGETDELAAQLEQIDFGATLQALRDSAEVTEDGPETIAGVATTRYVGTTTLRSVMLAQGTTEEQLEEEAAAAEEFGDAGPDLDEQIPLTVWIGDDGLVRRFDYTTATGDLETTQSMTVLEYGLEVDITAPPAEATISVEEFESSYQSSVETYEEYQLEGSEGTITLESESSVTVESGGSATTEAVPAPKPTADSDG